MPRVFRDAEGNVQRLRLSGMQLLADDFAALTDDEIRLVEEATQ